MLQVEGRSRRHQACGRHIPHRETSTIVARITKLMCVLRVTGRKFDPAKHLALSTLRPYAVFRAGDPRLASRPDGPRHEFSGFKVDVSRRSWASLVGQVADAIGFLKKHRQALAKLRRTKEVEDIRLDFPLDLRIDRKTNLAQFDYFPPKLVSLAGALGCGLEISIYPPDLEQLARGRQGARTRRSDRNGHRRTRH